MPSDQLSSSLQGATTATAGSAVPASFAPSQATATGQDLNAILAALEHDRIAALAYSYWEQRGRPDNSAEEDWLRAEQEIHSGKTTAP